jgi:DNA-binding CsgD family transcriptional regulator/tetratricopeptide (TPR) repeat protein
VLRFAPDAAEQAAAAGARREAAAQFARALRFADELPWQQRGQLLARRSYECYLTGQAAEAIDARRGALAEHQRGGDRLREGDDHRWLSRLAWFATDNATAETEAVLAVDLLEQLPPGPELAMAYSNRSQLGMLSGDWPRAVTWGGRAIALAEQLGETETLVHALNNVGTAELLQGHAAGSTQLEESLRLALDHGFAEHAARAFTNLGVAGVELRQYAVAERYLSKGTEYCRDHDLDTWLPYMVAWKGRAELDQGRWELAAELVASVLVHPGISGPTRIVSLTVLGCLRARRGEPDAWPPLDEALELAAGTGELQRLGPVAAARAEARWLAGQDDAVAAETETALALALSKADEWRAGELAAWRHRAGIADDLTADQVAEPYRLEQQGDGVGAARRWSDLGRPYEAALALAGSDCEASLREGVTRLRELGAWPAASRVARELRQRGVLDIGVGPRSATRANPAGLTARELQVLELVTAGLRNSDIAARLFLSEKTVGHHASAIFRKLGVRTRGEAADYAVRTGIVER